MHNNASFLTMLEQPCVIARLKEEVREALREIHANPRAYITSALTRDVGGSRRQMLLRVGLAIGILIYTLVFVSMLVFWSLARHESNTGKTAIYVSTPIVEWPRIELPNSEDKAGGGGGGGRDENRPPSAGNLPTFSLTDPIIVPRPESPLSPPVLPTIETLKVDPKIQVERDPLSPTGLPDGASVLPSAGPGKGGGMGTGSQRGMGPGEGLGAGPGSGYNIGGLEPAIGGKPRSGSHQPAVDSRPILLNQPRPLFTEEARRNKVQGVVRVRVLVDANGGVKEVVITRGLPDGLNDQAIRAAYQMRFRPAMKDGRPVSYWLSNVEIEFNLR